MVDGEDDSTTVAISVTGTDTASVVVDGLEGAVWSQLDCSTLLETAGA